MKYELSLFWSYRYVMVNNSKEIFFEVLYNILLLLPMGIVLPNSNINEKTKQEFSKQWSNEIGRFLPINIEELAVTTGELQRKRGVKTATDVLKMLLLYAVSGMSFKFLALCADALGISKISDTAWRKKMLPAKEWLREILNHSLTTLVSSNLSDQSRDVYLIDGSTIRQEGKEQKQVRIHMSYHLKKNCMQEIKVTDHHGAESFSVTV